MKRQVATILVASAGLLAAAWQQFGTPPAGVSGGSAPIDVVSAYNGEGGPVKLAGVCSIDADSVACWDSSGTSAPALAKLVEDEYRAADQLYVPFYIGRKNRLAVLSTPDVKSGGIATTEGGLAPGHTWRASGQRLTAIVLAAREEASTSELIVTLSAPSIKGEVSFRVGERATFGDLAVEVGRTTRDDGTPPRVHAGTASDLRPAPGGSFWAYAIGFKTRFGMAASPIVWPSDKDHNRIRYVDLKGKPISAARYAELGGRSDDAGFTSEAEKPEHIPKCDTVHTWIKGRLDDAISVAINVDPQEVKYLQIETVRMLRLRFTGIPLDPKSWSARTP